jgi:NADP-dependent 3-hydroxy acid dehydrogenase YdfG
MITATSVSTTQRSPQLLGQTVVVLGGSAGIGYETARLARAEGADVILTARNPEHLRKAAGKLGAVSTATFDATDSDALGQFLAGLPTPVDHVMVTAGGSYYAPLADIDFAEAHQDLEKHLWLALHVGQGAAAKVRPGGTLIFMTGTGGRRPGACGCGQPCARARADQGQPDRRRFR